MSWIGQSYLLTPSLALSRWGPSPKNIMEGTQTKEKNYVWSVEKRFPVPGQSLEHLQTGRKEGWCLGSSSRDRTRGCGGGSEFRVSEQSSLSPVNSHLGPCCHSCGRGSGGSTNSRPRPSLALAHHPGSRPAGSGARLQRTVWKPTASASPNSHSTPPASSTLFLIRVNVCP